MAFQAKLDYVTLDRSKKKDLEALEKWSGHILKRSIISKEDQAMEEKLRERINQE